MIICYQIYIYNIIYIPYEKIRRLLEEMLKKIIQKVKKKEKRKKEKLTIGCKEKLMSKKI